jgi:hypothetical protein
LIFSGRIVVPLMVITKPREQLGLSHPWWLSCGEQIFHKTRLRISYRGSRLGCTGPRLGARNSIAKGSFLCVQDFLSPKKN